ncbi:hypothetical protein V1514DRAFT_220945 [Lipomyces japonicus]|uniref:uncharacterized protein n=1 Tax=Lipomyces japonicus TaxID=56871 RepID=UPI0034CD67E2
MIIPRLERLSLGRGYFDRGNQQQPPNAVEHLFAFNQGKRNDRLYYRAQTEVYAIGGFRQVPKFSKDDNERLKLQAKANMYGLVIHTGARIAYFIMFWPLRRIRLNLSVYRLPSDASYVEFATFFFKKASWSDLYAGFITSYVSQAIVLVGEAAGVILSEVLPFIWPSRLSRRRLAALDFLIYFSSTVLVSPFVELEIKQLLGLASPNQIFPAAAAFSRILNFSSPDSYRLLSDVIMFYGAEKLFSFITPIILNYIKIEHPRGNNAFIQAVPKLVQWFLYTVINSALIEPFEISLFRTVARAVGAKGIYGDSLLDGLWMRAKAFVGSASFAWVFVEVNYWLSVTMDGIWFKGMYS